MECCLEGIREFEPNKPPKFEMVEKIVESDHFDLYACKCSGCSQLYLGCYREVCTWDYDDSWSYWVPITNEDLGKVRRNHQKTIEVIESRKHLVWHPDGVIDWNQGPPIGLVFG